MMADTAQLTDPDARVLVVVAHPDDETFGTGSLLLHLSANGVATGVACASRGEGGGVREGVPVPNGGVGVLREAEFRLAAASLGVSWVRLLGLLDSGMDGDPPAGSVCGVGADALASAVDQAVASFGPTVLVTLDGSDGHRDHLAVRAATEAVGRARGLPVWLHCLPRRLMRQWAELLAGRDPDSPYLALGELGTPDEAITTRIDTSRYLDRRWAAIDLHRSQVSPYEALPEHLRRAFLTEECLVGTRS